MTLYHSGTDAGCLDWAQVVTDSSEIYRFIKDILLFKISFNDTTALLGANLEPNLMEEINKLEAIARESDNYTSDCYFSSTSEKMCC